MKVDFNELIDKHIARQSKPKSVGRYYPSEIGRCMRKTWYSYNYPTEVEADLRKVFEAGNIMHDFVASVLRSEKTPEVELLKAEMPLKFQNDDFIVSGRVDDVILLKMDGRMMLLEVKSTKSLKYAKKPSKQHIMQLQFYMSASGIHNGVILYIDKTNLQTRAFEVKFDKKDSEKIIERFGKLHTHLINKDLPVAEAKRDKEMEWMCRFCEYKENCEVEKK